MLGMLFEGAAEGAYSIELATTLSQEVGASQDEPGRCHYAREIARDKALFPITISFPCSSIGAGSQACAYTRTVCQRGTGRHCLTFASLEAKKTIHLGTKLPVRLLA